MSDKLSIGNKNHGSCVNNHTDTGTVSSRRPSAAWDIWDKVWRAKKKRPLHVRRQLGITGTDSHSVTCYQPQQGLLPGIPDSKAARCFIRAICCCLLAKKIKLTPFGRRLIEVVVTLVLCRTASFACMTPIGHHRH